jgi:hypothetical protein
MFRVATHHRILVKTLVTAVVATVAATAPAAASDAPSRIPAQHAVNIVAATCGGPNEIVECAPPVKSRPDSPIDHEAQPTCGGPNEIVECPPPVDAKPRP